MQPIAILKAVESSETACRIALLATAGQPFGSGSFSMSEESCMAFSSPLNEIEERRARVEQHSPGHLRSQRWRTQDVALGNSADEHSAVHSFKLNGKVERLFRKTTVAFTSRLS